MSDAAVAPPVVTVRDATLADLEFLVDGNAAMALETENIILNKDTLRLGCAAVLNDRSKGFYLMADCQGVPAGQLMVTYEHSDWRNGKFPAACCRMPYHAPTQSICRDILVMRYHFQLKLSPVTQLLQVGSVRVHRAAPAATRCVQSFVQEGAGHGSGYDNCCAIHFSTVTTTACDYSLTSCPAASTGVCGIRLYAESHNSRAHATYKNCGMTETDYRIFEIDYVISRAQGGTVGPA
jgi:hypothetical protein